jgi:predicted aconitase with swiveling domain
MERVIHGHAVVPGAAVGPALVTHEPISFWGGYDQKTGEIIDRRHPLSGRIAAGRVLVVPFTRGSSTSTAILLESVRAGVAPAAIISREVDTFMALASVVADELYGKPIPIVALSEADFGAIKDGELVRIEADGTIRIEKPPA